MIIDYTLTLQSDAEPGTGIGTELVNDFVPRNFSDHPVLRASHLKGLLLEYLKHCSAVRQWPASLCERIFGKSGTAAAGTESPLSFTDAEARQGGTPHLVTRTAVDLATGTVQETSLRTTEAVGVGTVFTLFLPQATPSAVTQAQRAPSTRFRTGRILVMDDDDNLRAMIGSLLGSLDYKSDLVRDGAEAIDLYRRYLNVGRPYDAVILDLTVKDGVGGEETFARLRLLDPDVRAIASSGGDSESLAKSCLEAGFCGWLGKPYSLSELGGVLQGIIG